MALKNIYQMEYIFETLHLCIGKKIMVKHDPHDKVSCDIS